MIAWWPDNCSSNVVRRRLCTLVLANVALKRHPTRGATVQSSALNDAGCWLLHFAFVIFGGRCRRRRGAYSFGRFAPLRFHVHLFATFTFHGPYYSVARSIVLFGPRRRFTVIVAFSFGKDTADHLNGEGIAVIRIHFLRQSLSAERGLFVTPISRIIFFEEEEAVEVNASLPLLFTVLCGQACPFPGAPQRRQ